MKKTWLIPLIALVLLVTAHIGLYMTDIVQTAHAADNGWGDEYSDDSDDESYDDEDDDEYYDESYDEYDEEYFSEGDEDALFLIQFLILMGLVAGIDDDSYAYDGYDTQYGYGNNRYNDTTYRPYDPLTQAPHDTGILRIAW